MAKWAPCKRKDFIKRLNRLGFKSPEPGGKHFYMRYGTYTFTPEDIAQTGMERNKKGRFYFLEGSWQ
jgi:hypothetical protein